MNIHLLTPLLFAGTLGSSSAPTPPATTIPSARTTSAQSLLATVPDSAIGLVHCDDWAAYHERAAENSWLRLLNSPHGGFLIDDFDLLRELGGPTLDALAETSSRMRGESLIFVTESGGAFLTRPPAGREELLSQIKALAPELVQGAHTLELSSGQLLLSEQGEYPGSSLALLDHPDVLGVLQADNEAALIELTRQCISRLASEERCELVQGYERARSSLGSKGGLDFFLDFSHLAKQAQEEIRDAATDIMPDPVKLLGLEQGVSLYLSLDVQRGTRIDCLGRLAIPAGTQLAKLADTFSALPPTLPGWIPAESWTFDALQWDVVAFSKIVRGLLNKSTQADVEQGLAGAGAMLNVDAEEELFGQLSGSFLLHDTGSLRLRAAREAAPEAPLGLGLSLGLRDSRVFRDALENVLGAAMFENNLDLIDLDGHEAYVFKDSDFLDGGFCILADRLAIALGRGALEQQVAALSGKSEASLLKGTPMVGIIDENQGACALSCVALGELLDQVLATGSFDKEELEQIRESLKFSSGAHMVGSARRVPSGFDIRIHTR